MNSYQFYKGLIQNLPLPQALVDLDQLDQNLEALLATCADRKIRVASKSIRCPEILLHLKHKLADRYAGVMAFYPAEAILLAQMDLGEILLAYPYIRIQDFGGLDGKVAEKICFMVDRAEHLQALDELAQKLQITLKCCVDIDLSIDLKILNFGVFRSSISQPTQMQKFMEELIRYPRLKLVGLMGYEAQIAGVTDKNPHTKLNSIIRLLKKIFIPAINQRREKMVELVQQNFALNFVNGGGTASLPSTTADRSVTEVTLGSGFYCPQLFSYYRHLNLKPAALFALEVTRNPRTNYYTCAGGGYVASGAPGWDKVPHPHLPQGCELDANEAAGEVQTPVKYPGQLKLGDPIFFRHSKAGELCERFNELILIKDKNIWKTAKTYRGMGQSYL